MKEAKRQAEVIEADKRESEIIKNLAAAAENKRKAAEQMPIAIDEAKGAIDKLIATVPMEHKQEAINVQNKALKLIKQLKGGGDVNDIIKQLNELRK